MCYSLTIKTTGGQPIMYHYDFILSTICQCIDTLEDTEYSEEERIAFCEGSLKVLTNYLISCQKASRILLK